MPAESPTPATPPPTTPNRWRRRAARLWWWMLPGMIATIVVLIACIVSDRYRYPNWSWLPYAGMNALTALNWSPVGWLDPNETLFAEPVMGFAEIRSHSDTPFVRERLREARAEIADEPDKMAEWMIEISGHGFPAPWLMRCETLVITQRAEDAWNVFVLYDQRFCVPGFRSLLGCVPVLREGDSRASSVRRVSPFVYDYLTYYPDPLGFLLNTVIFSTLWMPITAWHRRRRANRGGCKRCGYSREGLAESAVCPECGLSSGA